MMSSDLWLTVIFAVLAPALVALWAAPRYTALGGHRGVSSFSAGVLAGAALVVVLPEVWSEAGSLCLGFLLIAAVDWFIHPLCASCGGGESAWAALPLWLALGAHSLLDGALIELAQPGTAAAWILLGHRLPEMLAVLALLRASQPRGRNRYLGWQVAALQLLVLAGFALATGLNPQLLLRSYAFAGGAVLFLAVHRLHQSWRESNLCWASSFGGAAGVWMVRLGLDLIGKH